LRCKVDTDWGGWDGNIRRSLLVAGGEDLLAVIDDGVDEGEVDLDVAHLVGFGHVLDGEGQSVLRVVDAQTRPKEQCPQVILHHLYSTIKPIHHPTIKGLNSP
jgi:hypothetical protein